MGHGIPKTREQKNQFAVKILEFKNIQISRL